MRVFSDMQALGALLTSFIVCAALGPVLIPLLHKLKFGQSIRDVGPASHMKKSGTPTMGGIAIFGALLFMTLIGGKVTSDSIIMLLVTFLFGLLGFLDDYIKVAKKHNLGLRAWQKLVLQILIAVGLAVYMAKFSGYGTDVWIPFINRYVDFGWIYIPFIAFVVVAMANAVNLTDGLDGFLRRDIPGGFLLRHRRHAVRTRFRVHLLLRPDRGLPGLPDLQPLSGKAVHGRYRIYGFGRRPGIGSYHHEGGVSAPHRRADLCAGGPVGDHPGAVLQSDRRKAVLQDGAPASPL